MNGGEFDNKNRRGSPIVASDFCSPLMKSEMDSIEPSPTVRRHRESKRVVDSVKTRVETELSDAKRTVQDLALKIEEANSRIKGLKQQRKPKWCEQEQAETVKNEDFQYAQVMKELEQIKQEMAKLKLEMGRVLKEKRNAEKVSKASSSKVTTFSSSMELIKKEIQELNEEQVLVELARIEAVKESEAIEAQRKEEANRYQTKLEKAKRKVEEIVQENEMARELQLTISDVNLLENELSLAKEMDRRIERTESMSRREEGSYSPAMLSAITEQLEAAKGELAAIKREGYNFMTSMDIIRDELKQIQDETARLKKAEEKRELTVQNLKSKILRAKAKLEDATAAEEKANMIASNLSLTLEQVGAEAEAAKKEKELISEEIKHMKAEIPKTESEIELAEERLEAAMEELKAVKLSETEALENLKNMIDATVQARDSASQNSSTITISNFEYEYLTGKAGAAEEIADKKVAAAQAWVEALKANEREILMKIEITQRELKELSVEVEEEEERNTRKTDRAVARRRSVGAETTRWGQSGTKVMATPRKSVYRVGNMTPIKRARSQKLRSPAVRHSTGKKKEKAMPNLAKFFSNKNNEMGK